MINFAEKYNREEILGFLGNNFLKDFQKDVRSVGIPDKKFIKKAYSLGYSPDLELSIFEFEHTGSTEKRVALTKEAFNVLRDSGNFRAIAVFYSSDSDDWRFSLMTATPGVNEKGKVKIILSNPKRYSFFLGPKAKVNTPTRFLITKGQIQSLEDLKERFSIEVVNKEFYKEISKLFVELVGGTLGNGSNKQEYKALLKLPGIKDTSQTAQEFAVRLIGRLIFCWFLREKRDNSDESLMPKSLISYDASKSLKDYYHDVLEPIFFKVLNVPINSRKDDKYAKEPYSQIPYLNGGLFSPHDDDFYSTNETKQEKNKQEVMVPDKWLQSLFEILEKYNFTIDENSAFDEELSIDPEMLGRIFENLLAEINPETGESARKSTGSYYTPRVIVDYMVDESLYLYLRNKTGIDEKKLRSLLSYDLDDDTATPLAEEEKEKVVAAIDELKILDPACGSGAFPMGALQKIVFILQQLDPLGQYWFKAQIKNVPIELRKDLEREHQEKNFDYIRKLGVIRRNIFGVDIQPIATEISRLRCFLTLVVDQKVDDKQENRGIQPLPNLDFKFVTANSLISLPENNNSKETIGIFEDSDRINELREIRDQFFNASNFDRIELKDQFRKIQLEMSKYYNSVKNAGANLTEMLLSWDPFSHKTTEWFDPEWMFGIKNGFGIVIGNPPYLGNKGHKEDFHKIQSSPLGDFYQRRMDLFYFFFHLAIKLSDDMAIVSLITTNYYLTATSADKLRKHIKTDTNIINLVNFNELRIFESATGQHNMITSLQRRMKPSLPIVAKTCITKRHGTAKSEILSNILSGRDQETLYYKINQEQLFDGENNYIRISGINQIENTILDKILNKIKSNGTPLDQLVDISAGIQSSADKVTKRHLEKFALKRAKIGDGIFVLKPEELSREKIEIESKFVKPWYKNSDIGKYWSNINEKEYVLYLKDEGTKQNVDKEILDYLKQFKDLLISRLTVCQNNKFQWNIVSKWIDRGEYYLLFYPRKQQVFESVKIISPQRSAVNTFGYNDTPWYASADVYFMTAKNPSVNLKYILALLNSKLYYLWFYHKGKRKGEILELYKKPLSEVPIKLISHNEQAEIVSLVEQALCITNSVVSKSQLNEIEELREIEDRIDCKIYELFRLTPNEIQYIEEQQKKNIH